MVRAPRRLGASSLFGTDSAVDREALESSSLGFQPSACSVSATDPTKKARRRDDTWPLHANAREAQVSEAQRASGHTTAALAGLLALRLTFAEIKPTLPKHLGLVNFVAISLGR